MYNYLLIAENLKDTIPAVSDLTGWEDQLRFLGIKLINVGDFTELILRFALNTFIIFFVTQFMYTRSSHRKDYYFSYLAIGTVIFLLCLLLSSVKLELGIAFGLFAVFGIIRYRTDTIPIREMTYLFIIIGISLINALSNKKVSYAELILTNFLIVYGLWYLEKRIALKQEKSIKLIYEKIENIHKNRNEEMLQDFKERTGIDISRFEIEKIDFLRDIAEITLYYPANGK